MNNIEMLKE